METAADVVAHGVHPTPGRPYAWVWADAVGRRVPTATRSRSPSRRCRSARVGGWLLVSEKFKLGGGDDPAVGNGQYRLEKAAGAGAPVRVEDASTRPGTPGDIQGGAGPRHGPEMHAAFLRCRATLWTPPYSPYWRSGRGHRTPPTGTGRTKREASCAGNASTSSINIRTVVSVAGRLAGQVRVAPVQGGQKPQGHLLQAHRLARPRV